MILRESDWQYPEYAEGIVHFSTKNESFLRLAKVYKDMGIKNWYAHLALSQPELEHVDPHDPTLSLEIKAKVVYEMFINPWYFFREVVRVPQDGADPTRFKISRASFALIWAFFNNIDIALLMIRQQGKTIVVSCLLVYLMRILKNSRSILLTRGSDLRSETISKMKQIRNALPQYAWKHSKSDADNTEMFTYDARNNKLLTCIAQNSIAAARNAGRGLTTARLFSDETAFTNFIRAMLPAALASGTTARRIAEEEGIPYGNVFTTTPGERDKPDGKMVYELFHDGTYWDEHFLDIPTRGQLIEVISHACKGDRVLIHAPFNHRQLGMTDLELYKAVANAGGTQDEKERDFGLKWTAGNLRSPLTPDEAETVSKSVISPAKHIEIFPNSYILKWYYPRNEIDHKLQKPHIIGMDTSDAVGRDNISFVMINSETLEVAATGIVNESNLVVFSSWVTDVLVKYLKTVLVVEKNRAQALIDALLIALPAHGIEPSRRLFNRVIQDCESTDPVLNEFRRLGSPRNDVFYETYRKHFGFHTGATSRKQLYGEVLQTAVRMAGHLVRDRQLATELLGLVVKNGRVDHTSEGHDDMVIAWLLACWFMLFGKRLEHYGVSNRILHKRHIAKEGGEDFDDEAFQREREEQDQLAEKIDDVCTRIARNRNPFVQASLDRELRVLLSKLKLDTSTAASVSELQELLKNERLKSRYL